MSIKLIAAGIFDTSQTSVAGFLLVDILACALDVQGAFFGTQVTLWRIRPPNPVRHAA